MPGLTHARRCSEMHILKSWMARRCSETHILILLDEAPSCSADPQKRRVKNAEVVVVVRG